MARSKKFPALTPAQSALWTAYRGTFAAEFSAIDAAVLAGASIAERDAIIRKFDTRRESLVDALGSLFPVLFVAEHRATKKSA